MTGPSEATREIVFERDQGECQFFCGGQEATQLSHFKHQGPGGLPPYHWKNLPSNLAASCGECHNRFPPNGNWRWVEFEPGVSNLQVCDCGSASTICTDSGLRAIEEMARVGVMRILDLDGNEVPERDLWFYNRWKKLAAIMLEGRL